MAAAPLLGATMGLQGAGTALSAGSTIAGGVMSMIGGNAQKGAADYQAQQLEENAPGAIGAAQRRMLDTQYKTKMAESTLEARAAGGGINAGVGSPVSLEKGIAARGNYQSLMDLFQGQNQATGMLNQAQGVRYSGDVAAQAGKMQMFGSLLSAGGTIAGGGASMLRTYGAYTYPNQFGRPGIGYG